MVLFRFVSGIGVHILWPLPWNYEFFSTNRDIVFSLEFSSKMQNLGRWWVFITLLPSPPMLDWRVLPMQRPVSHPCVGWASLPQLSYLCQNFIPHPYIPQPITCGVNPKMHTCWAVLPHLSIFHLFFFPHCVWGEGPWTWVCLCFPPLLDTGRCNKLKFIFVVKL